MPLHFTEEEFSARQQKAVLALQEAGLDALLIFAPENQYWLCGYDTFGFSMFQCLVLTKAGALHLLTRLPDRQQARHTSTLNDEQIHIWHEAEGRDPTDDLLKLLSDLGVSGGRLRHARHRRLPWRPPDGS
ncbi:MAG: aminopeptidase P family N-terminal domain-containing protein, partial [Pseudomonadota bacterium]